MKKSYFLLCLLLSLGISTRLMAQVDPGTTNLTHQWTFDDGSAKDVVGTADGTIVGSATLVNNALSTANGGYMTFDAAAIGINSYSEATVEIWFTSVVGAAKDFSMLSYFGNTTGTVGTDYLSICPARNEGVNPSRAAISCLNTTEPWTNESYVNGPTYVDAKLHHMVVTVDATNITLYVDGANIGTSALSANNILANIGTQFAYLAKGGYTGDPTWKGLIHKYSLYNKALTADNILYLFNKGAEDKAVITTTVSSLVFDPHNDAREITVSSSNLSANITVTAPAGITVLPATITKNTLDVPVTVVYSNAPAVIDGNITFTSGNTVVTIPVKTAPDASCFTELYKDVQNMIVDPGLNDLSKFGGWGTKEVMTIISSPENVYCGASSIRVGNGTTTGSGSLDYSLTGAIAPNTTYRVRAMVKTVDGTFQLGVFGYDSSKGDLNNVIDTQGEWKALDFYFTTGPTLGTTQGMFFNNWSCTGKTGYIDNWEMYIASEPIISTSATSFAFDPQYTVGSFTVTASNLLSEISVSAPVGVTVNPTTLPADAAGTTVVVTYDGSSDVNGNITLTSGTSVVNIPVKSTTTVNCYTPLYTDRENLITDPNLNDLANFGGWGAKSLVSIIEAPDSVYCGSHSGLINGGGSIDATSISGKILPSSTYVIKARVKTHGDFRIGISGINTATTGIFEDTINTNGAWEEVRIEVPTGTEVSAAQNMYFNNYQLSGVRGYIDNWEMYRMDASGVPTVNSLFANIYVQNGKITVEFDANQSSAARLSVYTIQGAKVSDETFTTLAGRNLKVVNANLPSGMYIVKITQNGKTNFVKIVK